MESRHSSFEMALLWQSSRQKIPCFRVEAAEEAANGLIVPPVALSSREKSTSLEPTLT